MYNQINNINAPALFIYVTSLLSEYEAYFYSFQQNNEFYVNNISLY